MCLIPLFGDQRCAMLFLIMANETKKVLTNKDILDSQGLVEVTNPDGSKSQITKEEAQSRLESLKQLQADLNQTDVVSDEEQPTQDDSAGQSEGQ